MSNTTTMNATPPRRDVLPILRRGWGWVLGAGILYLVGGIAALVAPVIASIAVALVVGVALAVGGVFAVIHAFGIRSWGGFFWQLLIGIITFIGGAVMFAYPLIGALTLTWLLAVVFVGKGIFEVIMGIQMRPAAGWAWMLVAGIVAILAGIFIFLGWPITGLYAPGTLAGISLLMTGITYISVAMALRRVT